MAVCDDGEGAHCSNGARPPAKAKELSPIPSPDRCRFVTPLSAART
jgi:hypothetical protein